MVIKDRYTACSIAEGFCEGEGASAKDQLRAWGYLIKTGLCWQLQGWYGRTAKRFIDDGVISSKGRINWQNTTTDYLLAD